MHLFPSLLPSLHHNCSRVNSAEEKRGVAKRFVHLLLDRLKSGKRCIKETIFVCIPCNEYTLEESFFASFLTLLCVRVCPPAGKTRGLGFYIAASCFIGTNLSLVYRALILPSPLLSDKWTVQPVFIVRFFQFFFECYFFTQWEKDIYILIIVPPVINIVEKRKEKGKKRGMFIIT